MWMADLNSFTAENAEIAKETVGENPNPARFSSRRLRELGG
jgi:hypothetical protein